MSTLSIVYYAHFILYWQFFKMICKTHPLWKAMQCSILFYSPVKPTMKLSKCPCYSYPLWWLETGSERVNNALSWLHLLCKCLCVSGAQGAEGAQWMGEPPSLPLCLVLREAGVHCVYIPIGRKNDRSGCSLQSCCRRWNVHQYRKCLNIESRDIRAADWNCSHGRPDNAKCLVR